MRSIPLIIAVTSISGLVAPAFSADIPLRQSTPAPSSGGQCQGFFSRPITDDLLPAMHDAACCDVLLTMYETAAVNDLERRLLCPAWHHFKSVYGLPAEDFDDLDDVDVPPEMAQAVIPPAVDGPAQPPQPLPQVPQQTQQPEQPQPQQPQQPQATPQPQQPQATPQPATVPWTMMNAPAEFPESVEWPDGYVPGPLNLSEDPVL